MNELNRPETAEQKLLCCLLLFLVSFWWHLVKPSAGLQPYKPLRGGHVMSFQPEMPHFICIHGNVCFLSAFGCELGGVYLPLALVNASEQKTGIQDIQQSSFIRLCLLWLFCQSQTYRWVHLKQWNDPRQTIPRQIGNYMPQKKINKGRTKWLQYSSYSI